MEKPRIRIRKKYSDVKKRKKEKEISNYRAERYD